MMNIKRICRLLGLLLLTFQASGTSSAACVSFQLAHTADSAGKAPTYKSCEASAELSVSGVIGKCRLNVEIPVLSFELTPSEEVSDSPARLSDLFDPMIEPNIVLSDGFMTTKELKAWLGGEVPKKDFLLTAGGITFSLIARPDKELPYLIKHLNKEIEFAVNFDLSAETIQIDSPCRK